MVITITYVVVDVNVAFDIVATVFVPVDIVGIFKFVDIVGIVAKTVAIVVVVG